MNCRDCQIIELAMITVVDGSIVDEFDEFIKVDGQLPPKITKLTGITDKMLDEYGVSEKIIADDLKNRLTPGTLMIAHNCQFDMSFLYSLLGRYYPDEVDEIFNNLNWLDTLTVFKDRAKYPHKLCDAVEHYKLREVNFHRAVDDTKALYEVAKAMKRERDDLSEYVNLFGYNPKYEIEVIILDKVEYKEQSFTNFMVSPNNTLRNKKISL